MPNLTSDRNTKARAGEFGTAPIAAATRVYKGGFALANAVGYLTTTSAVACLGVLTDPPADSDYDNSAGLAGAKTGRYRRKGRFDFTNSGTSPATTADIGKPLYAENDNVVSMNPAAGPYVGTVGEIEGSSVWVDVDPSRAPAAAAVGAASVAALQTLLADEALVFNTGQKFYPVVGQAGAVELSAAFPDGSHVGQEIVLVGTDATNTVTVPNGINTKTANGQSVTLGAGDTLSLVWYGGDWIETSRSINNA